MLRVRVRGKKQEVMRPRGEEGLLGLQLLLGPPRSEEAGEARIERGRRREESRKLLLGGAAIVGCCVQLLVKRRSGLAAACSWPGRWVMPKA